MAFPQLGYPGGLAIVSSQSSVSSINTSCDQLGGLLPYSSSLSASESAPQLASFYSSRLFPGLGTGSPITGGPGSTSPCETGSGLYPCLSGAYPAHDQSWRGPSVDSLRQAPYPHHPGWTSAYSYSGNSGLDLNGARRKNVTRESTATLKAWLQEHIKNPYPTKGEKIMLAIITKMTLTQVSTWFANARRRLKKENKMTWSPRHRGEDGDLDMDDNDSGDEMTDHTSVKHLGGSELSHGKTAGQDTTPDLEPAYLTDVSKPKIWSLAMTATSCGPLGPYNNNNLLPSGKHLPPVTSIGGNSPPIHFNNNTSPTRSMV